MPNTRGESAEVLMANEAGEETLSGTGGAICRRRR